VSISVALSKWTPGVRAKVEELNRRFPDFSWGTYVGHDPTEGRASDGMVPRYQTAAGKARGWEVARWVWANRVNLGVWYVIFDGKIISQTRPAAGWQTYYPTAAAIRKNRDSAYHYNHVHISFYNLPAPAKLLPPYVVDPEKITTKLTANAPTGQDDEFRPPGFVIDTGVEIVEEHGFRWLITKAGYSYRLDFLVLESEYLARPKPAPPADTPEPTPEPVPSKPARIRVMCSNTRLYSASQKDGHPWDNFTLHAPLATGFEYRVEPFKRILTDFKPDLIGAQECDSKEIAPSLITHLNRLTTGASWAQYGRGQVRFLYNQAKLALLQSFSWDMDNAAEADRRLIMCEFQVVGTDRRFWAVVTHLGVGFPGAEVERLEQAAEIMQRVTEKKAFHGLVMGDFNDPAMPPTVGVRTVLQGPEGQTEPAFYDMRNSLSDEKMHGDSLATSHGYKALKALPDGQVGRWIDDICASEHVTAVEGWVVDTSATSKKYKGASDHCALVLDVEV
jgi:endonuclease/exonuclease/phosphatase family metal-dependent hydrolase